MNLEQRIGGNSNLSLRGKKYSEKLAEFVKKENLSDLVVWTSQFKRTIQTASKIDAPKEQWKALNEIDAVKIRKLISLKLVKVFHIIKINSF